MPSPLTPPLPSVSPDEVGNVGSRCPAEAMAKASWFLGNCGLLPFVSTANYLEVPDDKIFIERKLPFLLIHVVIPEVLLLGWVLFFFVDKEAMDDILNDIISQMNWPKWLKVPTIVSFILLLQLNASLGAVFAYSNKKIKKLNLEISNRLPPLTVAATKTLKKSMFRFVMLRSVLFVLSAACLLIGYAVLGVIARNLPLPFALYYLSFVFAFYPLGLMLCEATVKVHFEFLHAHFKALQEKLATINGGDGPSQNNLHREKKGKLEEVESLMDQGLALVECMRKMDRALGRMMLTQAGIYTLNEIVLLYFLSISYPVFEKLTWAHLVYGMASEIIVVNNTWQKFHLFTLSQTLTHLKRKCWGRLVKLRREPGFWPLSPCLSYKLDLLQSELERREGIRPCDAFALNYDALCGSYGLLLTYSFVLIQFTTAEE